MATSNEQQAGYNYIGSSYSPTVAAAASKPSAGFGFKGTVEVPDVTGTGAASTTTDDLAAYKNERRTSVFDAINTFLSQIGLSGLSDTVKQWAFEDKSDDWIRVNLRTTEAWKQRFPGLVKLQAAGQFMSEAEYIEQERSYTALLRNSGLPSGFYDDPSDFGGWIANGVSVKEVEDRVTSAKTLMDSRYPSEYRQAMKDFYGVDEGQLLAYTLDADKAQSLITRQLKTAALGGAANARRFGLDAAAADKYAATLGSGFDSLDADDVTSLESTFGKLGTQADLQGKLAGIEKDKTFKRTDVLDAQLLSNAEKEKSMTGRSKREQARFGGQAGFGSGSLARTSGV